MDEVFLTIKLSGEPSFHVRCSILSTVLELKELISKHSGLLENQQRLVFNGKILNDNLTLSFYNIKDKSTIYLVPTKRSSSPHSNPKMMIEKLKNLLNDLHETSPIKARTKINEIRNLITNPLLLSFAAISSEALEIIEEAQIEIDDIEQDADDISTQYIAQANDTALNQIESSADGLRTLTAILDDDKKEDTIPYDCCYDEPTVICPKPTKISDSPLPTLSQTKIVPSNSFYILPTGDECHYEFSNEDFWCETDFKRYMKQKYAQQVAMLKDMGFDDEQIVLQALGETGGNVLLAFQILQSRIFQY